MVDHVAEYESRSRLLNCFDDSSYKHFSFVIKNFIRMTSMTETNILKKTVKASNNSAAYDDNS